MYGWHVDITGSLEKGRDGEESKSWRRGRGDEGGEYKVQIDAGGGGDLGG